MSWHSNDPAGVMCILIRSLMNLIRVVAGQALSSLGSCYHKSYVIKFFYCLKKCQLKIASRKLAKVFHVKLYRGSSVRVVYCSANAFETDCFTKCQLFSIASSNLKQITSTLRGDPVEVWLSSRILVIRND